MRIDYRLCIPMDTREAKARDLPPNIGHLLIWPEDSRNLLSDVAEIIFLSRQNSQPLIAQSLSPFHSSKWLKEAAERHNLPFRFDSEFDLTLRRPCDILVECGNQEQTFGALALADGMEEIVFYSAAGFEESYATILRVIEAGNGWPKQSGFMDLIDVVPYFLFFSSTHDNIEIFGSPDAVNSLYRHYRSQPSWIWSDA